MTHREQAHEIQTQKHIHTLEEPTDSDGEWGARRRGRRLARCLVLRALAWHGMAWDIVVVTFRGRGRRTRRFGVRAPWFIWGIVGLLKVEVEVEVDVDEGKVAVWRQMRLPSSFHFALQG